MTDHDPYADGPSAAVQAFTDGIGAASGGAITVTFAYGITSRIEADDSGPWLTHRYGTGVDVAVSGTAAYRSEALAWLSTISTEIIDEGDYIHLTLSKMVDLAGCPKAKKKKAEADLSDDASLQA